MQIAQIPETVIAPVVTPPAPPFALHALAALASAQPAAPSSAVFFSPQLSLARNPPLSPRLNRKNSYALLKLSSRARFTETFGRNIRIFITDFGRYLQMYARRVHDLSYFLFASFGTEEAEQVRHSQVAESVADYSI